MKKIITTILALSTIACLVSCKNNDNTNKSDETSDAFFVQEIKFSQIAEYEYELTKNISKTSSFSVANFYKECKVTKVKSKASMNNTYIKELTLGYNMKYVGDYAFKGCINLKNVTLCPNACFGEGAFEDCDKIEGLKDNNLLYLKAESTDKEEENEYYYLYKTNTLSKSYVTNINTVSIIDAFRNNKVIESITLNSGVKYINSSAFKNSNLKSINIPSSVIYIGTNAFSGVSNLNITLEQNIKGYFTQDGESKVEVTLSSDNVVDYLTSTYVNYFFYKEA